MTTFKPMDSSDIPAPPTVSASIADMERLLGYWVLRADSLERHITRLQESNRLISETCVRLAGELEAIKPRPRPVAAIVPGGDAS